MYAIRLGAIRVGGALHLNIFLIASILLRLQLRPTCIFVRVEILHARPIRHQQFLLRR